MTLAEGDTGASEIRRRAEYLDSVDPLADLRRRFELPEGVIYLDGHSLGALPVGVAGAVTRSITDDWGRGLASSWETGWLTLPQRVGDRIGRLIGARAGEVVAGDSTSIALAKMLGSALALRPGRRVVTTEDNFPTDLYIAEGVASSHGVTLRRIARTELDLPNLSPVLDGAGVLLLTHVDFRTGTMFDLERLTTAAHAAGSVVVWDLSHSAGAVPVGLHDAGVDFALGCGYKYLNGGPGAPAFCFVHEHRQVEAQNPLPGWMGHAAPFDFDPEYVPAGGITRFLTSTPPVIGLVALDAALKVFDEADIESVRAKSLQLSDFFIDGLQRLADRLEVVTPLDHDRRGSQVSCRVHASVGGGGEHIVRELAAAGILTDFRPPDIVRFGLAASYVRFIDIAAVIDALARVVSSADDVARSGLGI